MTIVPEILEQNRKLADRINAETRADPQSPYTGKYVGIVNGSVVAIADTLSEALNILRQVESDPAKRFCIEANRDYSVIEDVWEST
jgi:hypothetical protein